MLRMETKMGLTVADCNFILESLTYTEKAFREYEQYPSYEFKQWRIETCRDVRNKIQKLKKELKTEDNDTH
jgi:hypothetical protein